MFSLKAKLPRQDVTEWVLHSKTSQDRSLHLRVVCVCVSEYPEWTVVAHIVRCEANGKNPTVDAATLGFASPGSKGGRKEH